MYHIKYLFLTFIFISFVACNATKETIKEEIKEEIKESNTSIEVIKIPIIQKTLIEQELDAYLQELSNFNTDAIVEMTYPRLFDVIDLDLFRQYIASMQNSTDLEFQLYDTNVTKLSEVITFSNGTQFTQAEYTSKIKIHFLKNTLYDTSEKINFLYDAFIHKFGTDNIHIDIDQRTLSIQKFEKLLMIKEKDSEWKFLGNDKEYQRYYPNFLPPEILKIIEEKNNYETF